MRGNKMKATIYLIVIAIIIGIFGGFVMEHIGYQSIKVEDGTIFGKIVHSSKDSIVIFIAGSGPTDMDGNSALVNGRNDSFAQLAKALKKQGISSFRYDKRTAGKSSETITEQIPEFDMFVSDCVACIRYIKQKGYKNIYLAGHSQGSLVGMLAAEAESVDGYISLAGAGLPIDVTLERQLRAQLGADSREVGIVQNLAKGKMDQTLDAADPMFSPDSQRFLLSWMKYDPAKIISELSCPTLLVQGSADLQVDLSEYTALKEAVPNSQAVLIDNMNHVLKTVQNQQENVAAYTDPSYNVDQSLVSVIVKFINE